MTFTAAVRRATNTHDTDKQFDSKHTWYTIQTNSRHPETNMKSWQIQAIPDRLVKRYEDELHRLQAGCTSVCKPVTHHVKMIAELSPRVEEEMSDTAAPHSGYPFEGLPHTRGEEDHHVLKQAVDCYLGRGGEVTSKAWGVTWITRVGRVGGS